MGVATKYGKKSIVRKTVMHNLNKSNLDKPSETKWHQVPPSDVTPSPSDTKWHQVTPSETKWNQVKPSATK